MKLQNRNGVLGLETAKQVMVTFLILSVTAIAVLLSLTALDDSIGDTIDISDSGITATVTNETNSWINTTGYTLSGYNSTWNSITLTEIWSNTPNQAEEYNFTIELANATVSNVGVITNLTEFNTTILGNASLSYTHSFTIDSGITTNIIGNISAGLVTFFASTGTIFSILIVVVIILAISIIIWAVGRFGQQTEGTVDL